MALIIVSTALLLVASGLVKVVNGNGPANVTHSHITYDLASDGAAILVGGCVMEVSITVVTFLVVILPT